VIETIPKDLKSQKVRKFGLITATALVMGNMIGSGVFLLPASLAPYGWNAVMAWVITITGVLILAKTFTDLSKKFPDKDLAGSLIGSVFGPTFGFMITWSYWVSIWTATATLAIAAISYLSIFITPFQTHSALGALGAIGLIWVFAGVNISGARSVGNVQIITLLLKLIPLFVVIVLIAMVLTGLAPEDENVSPVRPFPSEGLKLKSITSAAALTLWALVGFEAAGMAKNKVRNPDTIIPKATLFGTLATGLIYLIVCSGIALMLPMEIASQSDAPFADFVKQYWAVGPASLIGLFAAISAIGALNGWSLLQGEVPLALSRAKLIPAWFGKTNAKGAPVRMIVISASLASLLLMLNSFKGMGDIFTFMALLSTSASLWLYLSYALVSLRLKMNPVLSTMGILFALWTLYGAGLGASGLSLLLMIKRPKICLIHF